MGKASTINIAVVIDKKGVVTLRKIGDESEKAGKKGEKGFNRARKSLADFNKNISDTIKLVIAMGAAWTAIKILSLAKDTLLLADSWTLLEGRLKLVTKGTEQLTRVEHNLYLTALNTHQAFEATATLYTGLARSTRELGISEQQLIGYTTTLNQAMVVSGATQDAAKNATMQLNQAMMGGVVRAEEYNSILENTPRILEAVADGLGVSMGALRKEMLEGQLSAERFLKGLEKGAVGVQVEFEQMSTTISQAMTDLKTVWASVIHDANKTTGATNDIATSIQVLANTIDENREEIISLFIGIVDVSGKAITAVGLVVNSIEGLHMLAMAAKFGDSWENEWAKINATSTDRLQNELTDLQIQLDAVGASYARGSLTTEGYASESAQLKVKIFETIVELDKLLGFQGAAEISTDELKGSTEGLSGAINHATLSWQELAQAQVAGQQVGATDMFMGIDDANERAKGLLKIENDRISTQLKLKMSLTDKLRELTLSELDYKKWALNEEVAAMRKLAGEEQDLQDMVTQYHAEKQEQMLKKTKALTDASEQLWKDFATDTGNIIGNFLGDLAHGEFDSFRDAFKGLLDSMLDMLISFVAKATAMSVIETIFNVDSGQTTLGDLLSGIGGWFSGSDGTQGKGMGGATVSDGAMHVLVVGGSAGGILEGAGDLWDAASELIGASDTLSTLFDDTDGAWDSIATGMADSMSTSLEGAWWNADSGAVWDNAINSGSSAWDSGRNLFGDIAGSNEFWSSASDYMWASSDVDAFWTTGGSAIENAFNDFSLTGTNIDEAFAVDTAKDAAIIRHLESLPTEETASLVEQVKSYYEMSKPYIGVASGALGIYGGFNAMQNGNYIGGGTQLVGGASQMYQSAVSAELIAGTEALNNAVATMGNVTSVVGGAYGVYSGLSDMAENGVTVNNAVSTASSGYNLYQAGSGLYNASSIGVSSATTVGAQSIIAAEGVGWGSAVGSSAGAGAGTGAGLSSYAGPIGMAVAMGLAIYSSKTQDKTSYDTSYGRISTVDIDGESPEQALYRTALGRMTLSRLDVDEAKGWDASPANETGGVGYNNLQPQIDTIMQDMVQSTMAHLEALAVNFDDPFAKMALALEPTTASFDMLATAASGLNVTTDQAAGMLQHATNAAHGVDGAFETLIGSLMGVGMSSQTAELAAAAMMNSVGMMGDSIADASMQMSGFGSAMQGVAGQASSAMGQLANYSRPTGVGVLPRFNEMHMDGGLLAGGSGVRDDLYIGTINGRRQIAVGGEYIMPQDMTAKYYPVLELMRDDNFADGGVTGGMPIRVPVPSGSGDTQQPINITLNIVADAQIGDTGLTEKMTITAKQVYTEQESGKDQVVVRVM